MTGSKRPRLERETPLLPRIVAECVCAEAAAWLEDDRPMRFAPALAARATRLYARNAAFARRLRAPGSTGREWLRVFFRHWLSARLARQHRALFHRLPSSFRMGSPLPSAAERRLSDTNQPLGYEEHPRANGDHR